MKICPYCREEVQSEAIECRFCQSMLLPIPTPEAEQDNQSRVTYIVDRDLVRFAKFAGAVLAIFLVVGASGPSVPDLLGHAATFVDKIVEGGQPADLPIEQPTKFDLVVNLETARALRLTIPQSLLLRADEVIE